MCTAHMVFTDAVVLSTVHPRWTCDVCVVIVSSCVVLSKSMALVRTCIAQPRCGASWRVTWACIPPVAFARPCGAWDTDLSFVCKHFMLQCIVAYYHVIVLNRTWSIICLRSVHVQIGPVAHCHPGWCADRSM